MDRDPYAPVMQESSFSDFHTLAAARRLADTHDVPYPRVYQNAAGAWSSSFVELRHSVILVATWTVTEYLNNDRLDEYMPDLRRLSPAYVRNEDELDESWNETTVRITRLTARARKMIASALLPVSVAHRYPGRISLAMLTRDLAAVTDTRLYMPRAKAARAVLAERVKQAVAFLRDGYNISDLGDAFDSADVDDDDNLFGALHAYSFTVTTGRRATATLARINDVLRDAGASRNILGLGCGHFGLYTGSTNTNRGRVCAGCLDDDYVTSYDDRWVHRDDAYYWESDGCYHTDPEPEEDDYGDDDDDDDDGDPDRLLDYSTNVMNHLSAEPSFATRSDGDFHMGVELETILTAGRRDDKVYAVRCELGSDYLVAKYDGSLSDSAVYGEGIEWVTRPTSLKEHIAHLGGWSETTNNLVAWDAKCCGMHVHIDSRAFTAGSLGKMLQFYNAPDNADFIRRIAGRHPDRDLQAQHYAGRDIDRAFVNSPAQALLNKDTNRYTMINLCNLDRENAKRLRLPEHKFSYGGSGTVEVRIFRASMRKERLLAQLEFTHAVVCFCRQASYRSLKESDFRIWLATRAGSYPHLTKFIGVAPNKHGVQKSTTHQPRARVDELEPNPALEPVNEQVTEDLAVELAHL